MKMLWLACFAVLVAAPAMGLISGAPGSACVSMTPDHYSDPRWDAAPYEINVVTIVEDEEYEVTISATGPDPFKGFLIQARESDSTDPLGTFFDFDDNAKARPCSGGDHAATHTKNDLKTSVTFRWVPDGADLSDLRFVATVVQRFDIFWRYIESQILAP